MKRDTTGDREGPGTHIGCSRERPGSRMDALLATLRSEVGLMRVQGADLTKQVFILFTAVDDFVKTVTEEVADSRQPSADSVDVVEVSQRSGRANSGCENGTPTRENETGVAVNGTVYVERADPGSRVGLNAEDVVESDRDCSAQPTNTGLASGTIDKDTADTDSCDKDKTVHRPAGHNHVTKTNTRTAADVTVVSSPTTNTKHTPSRHTKRSHGDRNRRSREQSRDVDTRRDHSSYADRLICKVARMTRVDVAELWSPRSHDIQTHHRRRHDCRNGDADNCVNNSSPVTTSSGYESDVACIREEEIDKLLHGDCSTADCRTDKTTAECREPFILRPDDKYEANYAMDTRTRTGTTGRHVSTDCHRNVQDMTSPRVYHEHTRKLSRVARSMEQIIRDLQAPPRITKRNAKPLPPLQGDVTSRLVNGRTCCVDERKLATAEEVSVVADLAHTSEDVLGCETSDMIPKVALRTPVIHDDEGRSAFRPYKPCSNTYDSIGRSNAGKELPPYGRPNDDHQSGNMNVTNNVHNSPEETHIPPGSLMRVVCSPSTLLTQRSASPDSGRGSWSNYGTSPDYADRKRQPCGANWRALRRLSEVDPFVESEPIYETIDDGAMLPRKSEYASPPPLPQRPVRCARRISATEGKYATVGECAGWGDTTPQLPPREYQHGRNYYYRYTDNSAVSTTDTASNNTQDTCPTRRTIRKPTAVAPSDGVAMRRQQPEVPHLEDIVKSSDIVDLSGAHVYTVADVLESIHGYVGHLSSGDPHPDKPTDEVGDTSTRRCPKVPNESVGRDTDYHLLTKTAKTSTSSGTRSSGKNAQCLDDAPSTSFKQDGYCLSAELHNLQDDSADWRRPRGCESCDQEVQTVCADLRQHSSDLVWSSNRPLQGTYC